MEELLNQYGMSAWWPVMVLVAVPLVVGGLWLRRHARRRAEAIHQARAAHRPIREVGAGTVTLIGLWRPSATGTSGIVEDEPGSEHRVLVERAEDAPPIPDGTMVLVVGCATHEAADPRPTGYRGSPRLWVVEARGDGHFVSARVDALERAAVGARARSGAGAILFACGVMVAVASCVIAYRASHDGHAAYDDSDLSS
jgi:hypothetical protein